MIIRLGFDQLPGIFFSCYKSQVKDRVTINQESDKLTCKTTKYYCYESNKEIVSK